MSYNYVRLSPQTGAISALWAQWGTAMVLRLAALCALLLGALSPAHADEIVLRADAPIVDVMINDKPARLLVDTILPDIMVLNPETTTRLGVRPLPVVSARAVFDDATVRARIARPRMTFANGEASRAFAGLFGGLWSPMAGVDGAIGPGVLPYDRVRIVLRNGEGGAVRTFPLPRPGIWSFTGLLAGEPAFAGFRLSARESMLNRPAAQFLDNQQLLTPRGDTQRQDFFLGLSSTVQRASTAERIAGFAIGDAIARTESPLSGADGVDVIAVIADPATPPRRKVTLGLDALASCYEIVWERAAGTLAVRCDG